LRPKVLLEQQCKPCPRQRELGRSDATLKVDRALIVFEQLVLKQVVLELLTLPEPQR